MIKQTIRKCRSEGASLPYKFEFFDRAFKQTFCAYEEVQSVFGHDGRVVTFYYSPNGALVIAYAEGYRLDSPINPVLSQIDATVVSPDARSNKRTLRKLEEILKLSVKLERAQRNKSNAKLKTFAEIDDELAFPGLAN